jgi:phosphoribosylamine-glycine ligase
MRRYRQPTISTVWSTFAVDNGVELVVIGPEIPLVLGLADRLAGSKHTRIRPERCRGERSKAPRGT